VIVAVGLYSDLDSFPDTSKVIQVFQIQIQTKNYIAKYNANTKSESCLIQIPATVINLSPCGAAVTLVQPLHVTKVGQSKKGKTKQATLVSDFHAHGSKSSLWPTDSSGVELTSMTTLTPTTLTPRQTNRPFFILPEVRGSIPH